jgi:transcriptional regulator with XRE-family HTH domain
MPLLCVIPFRRCYMTTTNPVRSTQASRLTELRRNAGLSQREVGEKVGRSDPRISAYEADPTIKIKMPILRKLAALYNTTPEYIETGKQPSAAEAFGSTSAGMSNSYSYQKPTDSNARRIPVDQVSMRVIPYLPIKARATFAESFADDSYKYEQAESLAVPNVPEGKEYEEALIVEVDGDSMDSGENSALRSGAQVLVTPVKQADWEYMPSGVYCFVYGTTFVIKRVKDNELPKTGLLTLHSDNPVGGTMTIRGEDIRAIWRVRRGVGSPIN